MSAIDVPIRSRRLDRSARRSARRLLAGVVALSCATFAVPAGALSGGSVIPDGEHGFIAKIDGVDGGCTGALVSPQWVLTAADCFAGSPGTTPAGRVTVAVGHVGLLRGTGHRVDVVELVRRDDRNVALAKLAVPIVDVTPVSLSSEAPVQGETLTVVGFGRTTVDWVPDRPRSARFSVSGVTPTTADLISPDGVDTCRGDAGGPALREVGGQVALVAINSKSWQRGCLGADQSGKQGSVEARIDDVTDWITSRTRASSRFVNALSGWCLDQEYPQGTDKPSTNKVGAWECNNGDNQRWSFEWITSDTARVINKHSGTCLDQEYPQGTDKPATNKVGAWGCNGGPNQVWKVAVDFEAGAATLTNNLSGWCLDQEYPQGTDKPGTHVVASWDCNGGVNQTWKIT